MAWSDFTHIIIPLVVFFVGQVSSARSVVRTDYCITYFGRINAIVDVPDIVPKKSFDGTRTCPRTWNFPDTIGATLELCPPEDYASSYWFGQSDSIAMSVNLQLGGRNGTRTLPIDALSFGQLLITNGSVKGPFTNDGKPAVLEEDAAQTKKEGYPSYWVINGTEKALIAAPNTTDAPHSGGVWFDCNNLPNKYQYCGTSGDVDGVKGCWSSQHFPWDMQAPLNFTIKFHSEGATVQISAEAEATVNGTGLGSFAHAHMDFTGDRAMPSVTDIAFWDNTANEYEAYAASRHDDMGLDPDGQGFPMFVNETKGDERFFTRNQTFSVESAAWSRKLPTLMVVLLSVVCALVLVA